MKSKINRNDPCYCGSGKKYKNCHGIKGEKVKSKYPLILVGMGILIVAAIIIQPVRKGPSGSGKPGQVWSEEHGHWHDAPGTPTGTTLPESTRPSGPAPEGKVWSEEHGHWHDAPGTQTSTTTPESTRPPGPAPEGKVWSEEHGHWHNAPEGAASEIP
ncbi:MAG: SEC-C domain-containing protein [Cyclobacteriaceae bacterium]|nr:SEC-C domain-containing protein [Cyclobacteriaceae bacterium]